jgi:hypothetical protein
MQLKDMCGKVASNDSLSSVWYQFGDALDTDEAGLLYSLQFNFLSPRSYRKMRDLIQWSAM